MVKIAFGISAYKDSRQVKRLINALQGDNCVFFVHVDKKANIRDFVSELKDIHNCHILKKRYTVQWGGWHQVKYQFLFLREMVNYPTRIDRLFVLSGQDYPLWNNLQIVDESISQPDRIWMKALNLTQLSEGSYQKRMLSIPHFFRDTNFHSKRIRRLITGGVREFFFRFLPNIRQTHIVVEGNKWDIWKSSGYFSCNFEVAKYILETVDRYPQIQSYFKRCFVPEELTIPTILFNSKYKDYAEVFPKKQYEGLSTLAVLHEFYYSNAIKIYQEKDFEGLINSRKMFCRKVETGVSDKLMDLIDIHRKKKS